MIKILYFQHTTSIGGASWSLFQLVQALDRKIFHPIVAIPKQGALGRAFEDIGIEVVVDHRLKTFLDTSKARQLHYTNLLGLWNCFSAIRAARNICIAVKPDIVHINTSVMFHLALGARKAAVAQIIIHARENWDLHRSDPRNMFKNQILKSSVDAIVAISQEAGKCFAPKLPQKIRIIHNWPDFAGRDGVANLRKEYGIAPTKKVILCLSGRSSIKGALNAIRAMEYVQDPNAILLLLGGKPDKHKIKIMIRKVFTFFHLRTYGLTVDLYAKKLKNKVVLAEWSLNVRSLIEQSMLVLCPFTQPHFSKAAIEAGALGKPVVISDDPYAREAVLDNETGILVPNGDTKALASAIDKLLDDRSAADCIGQNAMRYIARQFNRNDAIRNIQDMYMQLIA